MITKYVRFDDDTFIMFSNDIPHESASRGPQTLSSWEHRSTRRRPISAGFVTIKDAKLWCYGRSVSLDLKSKSDDSDMLNKSFVFS